METAVLILATIGGATVFCAMAALVVIAICGWRALT